MKTTSIPALTLLLVIMLAPQATRASTAPGLAEEGDALEAAPAATLASAELQPGPAKVAGRNVNVRAKATIKSEIITQMQDGEEVFVEQVILRPEAKGKDPARWAKVAFPSKASTWVHSLYIDESGTVKPKKLNVRAGPGENHTVVGGLVRGDAIEQLGSKGDWLLIQPPEGTTAFIAAKLLRQEVQPLEEATPPAEIVATEGEVVETAVVESQTEIFGGDQAAEPESMATETDSVDMVMLEDGTTATETEEVVESSDMALLPEVAPVLETMPEDPLPPRIVDREGVVRTYTSPHAPSHYKLVSADNGRLINYLFTTSTNLDLGRYVGLHIVATGEEALDERWNTPVLTLNKIIIVDYED